MTKLTAEQRAVIVAALGVYAEHIGGVHDRLRAGINHRPGLARTMLDPLLKEVQIARSLQGEIRREDAS